MKRWFAPVGQRTDQPIRQFRAHLLKRGSTKLEKREMGWPRVVVLLSTEDGPMLYRYTATGAFAGDVASVGR